MDIKQVLEGISLSPLEADVKKALNDAVRQNQNDINRVIRRYPTAGIVGQVMNFEFDVARHVVKIMAPVLKAHDVPAANGRDLTRHIYKCLGGRQEPVFEITDL